MGYIVAVTLRDASTGLERLLAETVRLLSRCFYTGITVVIKKLAISRVLKIFQPARRWTIT